MPIEQDELAWDRIKHDDHLFTNRCGFFLLFESILFASIGNAAGTSVQLAIALPMVLLAQLVTAVWAWTSYRHLAALVDFNRDLRAANPHYAQTGLRHPGAHWLMGVLLPALIATVWSVVTFSWTPSPLFGITVSVATLLIWSPVSLVWADWKARRKTERDEPSDPAPAAVPL